jgi:hypothetical protein
MHKTRTLCYTSARVHRSRVVVLVSCASAIAIVTLALTLVRAARADGDDRAVAQALIASGASLGPAPVTGPAVAAANDALERATRFRAAGDEVRARAADGLAREWAETARDLAAANAAEEMAEDRKQQAIQSRAQLQRTKALVEEGLARLGRLRAELEAASGPVKHAPSAATTAALPARAHAAGPTPAPAPAPVPASASEPASQPAPSPGARP